jgi:hypothetical protein
VTGGKLANDKALAFMTAGNCEVTIKSLETGITFSYKLIRRQSFYKQTDFIYYLKVRMNNVESYAGNIEFNRDKDKYVYWQGQKGKLNSDETPVRAIMFVLNALYKKLYSINVEIYHCGTCGVCGKPLTNPESIMTGIGPSCARKLANNK